MFGRCDTFHVEDCLKSIGLPIFVCGSNVFLDNYKKGNLSPTEKAKIYEGRAIISPYDSDMPGVEPLDNTPDKIDIDQRLASVLNIKPQLLQQISLLADAEDTSP